MMRISQADLTNNNVIYDNIFDKDYLNGNRTDTTIEWLEKTPFVIIEHTKKPAQVSLITHSLDCNPSVDLTHLEGGSESKEILKEPIKVSLYKKIIGQTEKENAKKFLERLTINGENYLNGEVFKASKEFNMIQYGRADYSVSELLLDIKLNTEKRCMDTGDTGDCTISFKKDGAVSGIKAQEEAFKKLVKLINDTNLGRTRNGAFRPRSQLVLSAPSASAARKAQVVTAAVQEYIASHKLGIPAYYSIREMLKPDLREAFNDAAWEAAKEHLGMESSDEETEEVADDDSSPPLIPQKLIQKLFNNRATSVSFFGEGGFANKSQIRDLLKNKQFNINQWNKIVNDEKDGGLLLPKEIEPDNFVRETTEKGDVKLGSGNFGDVYKGYCNVGCTSIEDSSVNSKTQVAIKTLSGGVTEDLFLEFIKEATIMAQYGKNPNLVELLGVKTKKSNKSPELEMILEFCEHGDLHKCLEDGTVEGWREERKERTRTIKETLTIGGELPSNLDLDIKFAKDIATGMSFLAEKKILHCDLSARNVLVGKGKDGEVGEEYVCKIADFGLSKLMDNGEKIWRGGKGEVGPLAWVTPYRFVVAGTPEFEGLSEQTDIWSFGCVLIEILTNGTQPWSVCDPRFDDPKKCKEMTFTDAALEQKSIRFSPEFVDDYLNNLCHFIFSIKDVTELEESDKKLISVIKKCWNREEEEKTFLKILDYISGGNIETEKCSETLVWRTEYDFPEMEVRKTGPGFGSEGTSVLGLPPPLMDSRA